MSRLLLLLVLNGLFSSQGTAADSAVYVIGEIDDSGRVRIVHARRTRMATPLHVTQSAQERFSADWSAVLVDERGVELARQQVDLDLVRVEYDHEGSIVHATKRETTGSFVLRLPYVARSRIEMRRGDVRLETVEVDAVIGATTHSVSTTALKPIGPQGDPRNRVDLLLLGDGYTAAEEAKFHTDARELVERFWSISPYREYASYFNVVLLFVPSAQSGADHPQCADPLSKDDPKLGQMVDTAFDATFCGNGTHRGVVVSRSKVRAAASIYPEWDRIGVIVNDDIYGGSGGDIWVVSDHELAQEIAQHEFGHSFTGLTDEYSDFWSGATPCSDVRGVQPCEPNATDDTSRPRLKWGAWVDATTPIPTTVIHKDKLGLFEGARYQSTGFYRPRSSCLMKTFREEGRSVPFCEICKEAFVRRLYEGWITLSSFSSQRIHLIEPGTTSPAASVVAGVDQPVSFSAAVLQTATGSVVSRWLVNGVPVAGPAAGLNDFTLRPPSIGTYTVTFEAVDTTPLVRSVTAELRSVFSWEVVVGYRRRAVRH